MQLPVIKIYSEQFDNNNYYINYIPSDYIDISTNYRLLTDNTINININDTLSNLLIPFSYNTISISYSATNTIIYTITDYTFINPQTLKLSFTVDAFRTYLQNLNISDSYISRIHPPNKNDTNFSQIDEPIQVDKDDIMTYTFSFADDGLITYRIVVDTNYYIPYVNLIDVDSTYYSHPLQFTKCEPSEIDGNIIDSKYILLPTTNYLTYLSNMIQNAQNFGYTSAIKNIYLVPSKHINTLTTSTKTITYYSDVLQLSETQTYLDSKIFYTTESITIQPPNLTNVYAKCFYKQFFNYYLTCDTNRQEYDYYRCVSSNHSIDFDILTSNSALIKKIYNPTNYNLSKNYSLSNTLSFSQTGTLNYDNTQIQEMQHNNKLLNNVINAISGVISVGTSAVTGNVLGTITSTASLGASIYNNYLDYNDYSTTLQNVSNSTSADAFALPYRPNQNFGVSAGYTMPDNLSLDRLNKYFSKFGYQYNKLIDSNTIMNTISNRNYTYIQGDINFNCNLMQSQKESIKSKFAQGVTLWSSDMYTYDY